MGRLCVQLQPSKSGTEQALEKETLSQVTETCWVVVAFALVRQTQTQIFMGQNGKQMSAFAIGSRQQSHKSQELQRGSSIRWCHPQTC